MPAKFVKAYCTVWPKAAVPFSVSAVSNGSRYFVFMVHYLVWGLFSSRARQGDWRLGRSGHTVVKPRMVRKIVRVSDLRVQTDVIVLDRSPIPPMVMLDVAVGERQVR